MKLFLWLIFIFWATLIFGTWADGAERISYTNMAIQHSCYTSEIEKYRLGS